MKIETGFFKNMTAWMDKNIDVPEGWIYLGDDKERYLLGQPGNCNLLIFGANPSKAGPGDENLDPTTRKVRKLSKEDGYDGWIMANLYPLRATNPKDLPDTADKKLLEVNIKVLKTLIKSFYIQAIWAAWGNIIDTRFYLGDALYDIQEELEGDFEWFYRGTLTNNGNPRHPLYMKSNESYTWFPVADYAADWRYAEYY